LCDYPCHQWSRHFTGFTIFITEKAKAPFSLVVLFSWINKKASLPERPAVMYGRS
jgi:hypothetical protein